jgi:hypothetical protein
MALAALAAQHRHVGTRVRTGHGSQADTGSPRVAAGEDPIAGAANRHCGRLVPAHCAVRFAASAAAFSSARAPARMPGNATFPS